MGAVPLEGASKAGAHASGKQGAGRRDRHWNLLPSFGAVLPPAVGRMVSESWGTLLSSTAPRNEDAGTHSVPFPYTAMQSKTRAPWLGGGF